MGIPPLKEVLEECIRLDLVKEEDGSFVPNERGWLLGNEIYGRIWDLAEKLYQEQADRNPEIEINYTKSGLGALICKNGVPVVDLFCESQLIGQYSKVGVIVLDSVYEGK